MKKILTILSAFLGLGFVLCVVFGFFTKIPAGVSENSAFLYKLLSGLSYLIKFLPMMLITGLCVSCSVSFGHNSEGSFDRFSKAMATRYKNVMIASLICTSVLTLTNETAGLFIRQKKTELVNQPKLIEEYISAGTKLFEAEDYDRAILYAEAVLNLEPKSEQAVKLKEKALVEKNIRETGNIHYLPSGTDFSFGDASEKNIDEERLLTVYQYYKKAQDFYANGEWLNAHYYAELGIKLAANTDPNLDDLKILSAMAWNNITGVHDLSKTHAQELFDQKFQGYKALVEGDELKAYYIFKDLMTNSKELSRDSDVAFYYAEAEKRIKNKYFFIDETYELQSFENANDVCYAYSYSDGSKDIIYYSGVTSVKSTGNTIQYLRKFIIKTLDSEGNVIKTLSVPYAKLMPISVDSMNAAQKRYLKIDEDAKLVPYLMLKAVGRNENSQMMVPEYYYEDGSEVELPDYIILPIEFKKFLMLQTCSQNPNEISLVTMFRFLSIANTYGYSDEVFSQILLNRLLYPFWMLLLFVLVAAFAWNNRIGATQYFKFSWILSFPLLILTAEAFYQLMMFLFRIINYVFLDYFSGTLALVCGAVTYLLMLIIASIYFLSRNTRN